jgi:hypothetical protein
MPEIVGAANVVLGIAKWSRRHGAEASRLCSRLITKVIRSALQAAKNFTSRASVISARMTALELLTSGGWLGSNAAEAHDSNADIMHVGG